MVRLLFVNLLLFSISMVCMGQTFQYSRGWTNGKRTLNPLRSELVTHFRRGGERLSQLLDIQDFERRLEECLLLVQDIARIPLQIQRSAAEKLGLNPNRSSNNNNRNNNRNSNPFADHHQSNEEFEDSNDSGEPSDYLKH